MIVRVGEEKEMMDGFVEFVVSVIDLSGLMVL